VTTSSDASSREALCLAGASLHRRGLTPGSSGNLSIRLPHGRFLVTPTGASLGDLDPAELSVLDGSGTLLGGPRPTKEVPLHLAMYGAPANAAVVHLHSPYAVAVSCLADVDEGNVLPVYTAYYAMRVGSLPLVPFAPPGDPRLGELVAGFVGRHRALLLANHGPVVAADSLPAAVDAIEELEANAQLHFILRGLPVRPVPESGLRAGR